MLNTILVAIDGKENNNNIINQALKTLQIKTDTKIIICHVFNPQTEENNPNYNKPHTSQDTIYLLMEQQLQNYQKDFSCNVESEILTGDPAEEIVRIATIYQANLIVLATRGLKGVKRIIEGSVSSQVLADAPCSVLILKSN